MSSKKNLFKISQRKFVDERRYGKRRYGEEREPDIYEYHTQALHASTQRTLWPMKLDCRKFAPEPIAEQDKGPHECRGHYYLHVNETLMPRAKKFSPIETASRYNDFIMNFRVEESKFDVRSRGALP